MTDAEIDAAAKYPPPLRENLLDLTSANSITKKSITAQHSNYIGKVAELVDYLKMRIKESPAGWYESMTKATAAVPFRFVVKIMEDWFNLVRRHDQTRA